MGIISVGRSLIIRQVLSSGLVLALGAFAWVNIGSLAGTAATSTDGKAVADALSSMQWSIALATGAAVVLMVCVAVPVLHFTIGRPVLGLAEALERMAQGDYDVAFEGTGRTDEIGTMARALTSLRDRLVEREMADRKATSENPEQTAKMRALIAKIEQFSSNFAAHSRRLNATTSRLTDSAELVDKAAKHANQGSDSIIAASTNAAGDVSSVATASEQLLDSIEEISRQVVQSTNVVHEAVQRAVDTNTGMGRLSAAAQKVGDVVSLISRIAAQTNLLALNATIEAARAGEAGRGFAVVAQEVKTLATQTAKATQDISGQISEMQQATELSVEAIDKIQHKIAEVEHISTIIASAVQEQGAATQEIARNVRSAAAGSTAMAGHIDSVIRSVGETSTTAAALTKLAREIDEIAGGMTSMVDSLGETIKAA